VYSNGMSKKISPKQLNILNIIAGFLHLIQGFVIVLLSVDFTRSITGAFLGFDPQTQSLLPDNTVLFDISLPWLVASFFFLSAIAHFTIATVYRKRYDKELKQGINRGRWIEYSLSASIMMVAISLLVGVYDLMSLVMIFFLAAIMNLMGLVMEIHNQTTKKTNWLSYWIGCLAGIIPWVVIAFYFWLGAENGSEAPAFVYGIFVSIFIFFNLFAINMVLQYKKIGPWKDYFYGERAYIILSLVAKTLLAWQVFAGTLQP